MLVGKPILRREDSRLLMGKGQFVDDIRLPEAIAHAAYVRSPHPHARIRKIDTERAKTMPGVLAVLTGEDWRNAGYGDAAGFWPVVDKDGKPANTVNRPFIPADYVRHVGEAVALVIAEDRYQAMEAMEAVEVDYEPLPANTSTARALDPEAPLVHKQFGTNLVLETLHGDQQKVEAAFAQAFHVTECVVPTNRVTAAPIEPRSYLGYYNAVEDHYTIWTSNQAPHFARTFFTKSMNIPEQKIRVIAPSVGGGFGMKIYHYPEEATVLWAAKVVGRPVRWTSTRSEGMMSDTHARDHYTVGQMAFDETGKILAVRYSTLAAFGAYESQFQASIANLFHASLLSCGYDIPAIFSEVKGVYTNTTPIDAYRGAGRPEAVYTTERLIENGAKEMRIDPLELRARNAIRPDQMPYETSVGVTYNIADVPELISKARNLSRYDELRREQERLRQEGVYMGIGISIFFDMAGAGPTKIFNSLGAQVGGGDVATCRVHPSGKVTIFSGSHSHGQGHRTTWSQIAADRLGCSIDDIEVIEGDTDRVAFGGGTWGSRSLSTGGMAVAAATDRVIEKAKRLVAHILECRIEDIDVKDGEFIARHTNHKMSFADLANAAYHRGDRPEGMELGLDETVFYDPADCNYPSAIHICVVIVDPDTGLVKIRDYFAVDDVGTMVNPMIVEGQVHGGLAQGIGQALMEECVYDDDGGQLLTGTFMDYAIPRASDLPSFILDSHVTLDPSNALGSKGAGESGTIGAPACVGNAVVDALWPLGIRQVTQPMTPNKVWRAIRQALAVAA